MKIWGDVSKVNGVYNGQKNVNKSKETSKTKAGKDVVSISGTAKDMQIVKTALSKVSDIRKEKVDELTARYRAGVYNPDGKEIAEKIVDSVFDKKA